MTLQNNDRLNEHDCQILDLTFELAEKAFELQEVPVGCILVFNSQFDQANYVIVGRGMNKVNKTKNPTRHAEFVAIEEAEQWCKDNGKSFYEVMENTTLYVTLEPCIMCASALYQLRIKKIVFGACNPRFGGLKSVASNDQYQHDHQIELISEVDVERSISLLKRFYGRENPYAPEDKRKSKVKNGPATVSSESSKKSN